MSNKKNVEEDVAENEETKKQPAKKKKASKTDKIKAELEETKIELAEQKDKFLRLFAEFDNFKKRNVKERLDLMSTASRDTMSALLPVLDDFDRPAPSDEMKGKVIDTIEKGYLLKEKIIRHAKVVVGK